MNSRTQFLYILACALPSALTLVLAIRLSLFGWPLAMLLILVSSTALLAHHGVRARMHMDDEPKSGQRLALAGCAALLSLGMTVILPPMQAPDENVHIWRAASFADGQFLPIPNTRERPATDQIDTSLYNYTNEWLELVVDDAPNLATRLSTSTRHMPWSGQRMGVFSPAAPYFPALYAPAAVALDASRELLQPVGNSIAWARIAMWATAMMLLYAALMGIRAGTHMMVAATLLPVTLQQMSSVNLDAITIPLAFLVTAGFTNGAFGVSPDGTRSNTALLVRVAAWVLLCLLCLAKIVFLVFLLPIGWWMLRGHWRMFLLPVTSTIIACILWQTYLAHSYVDTRIELAAGPIHRMLEALSSPIGMFTLFWRTIDTLGEFYIDTMVGVLGWLDTPLPAGTMAVSTLTLMMAVVADALAYNPLQKTTRAILSLSALACAVGTILLMWAVWTPPGVLLIAGVQGRYFTPVLPALAIALGLRKQIPSISRLATWLFVGTAMLAVAVETVDIPATLLERYWQ